MTIFDTSTKTNLTIDDVIAMSRTMRMVEFIDYFETNTTLTSEQILDLIDLVIEAVN